MNLVWFRKDLRLDDNLALSAALKDCLANQQKMILAFHINPKQIKNGLANDYFFSAVSKFIQDVKLAGIDILIIEGEIERAFSDLIKNYPKIDKVFFNYDERGFGKERDGNMIKFFNQNRIEVKTFLDSHLVAAQDLKNQTGRAYKVFTPYYNKWVALQKPEIVRINLNLLKQSVVDVPAEEYDYGIGFLNQIMSWSQKDFSDIAGRQIALRKLHSFIETSRVEDYHTNRDFPAINGTSRLSQHISTGEISIREVFWLAAQSDNLGAETFIKELAWRDFYHQIYANFPQTKNQEFIKKYQNLDWLYNKKDFEKMEARPDWFQ